MQTIKSDHLVDPQPHSLGGFQLRHPLGHGSFATAYLAQQLDPAREAVVKVAHPHLISGPHGDMIRQRFDAEVQAITRIQHPNMVTVYTSGLTPQGIPYIAMELVQGRTLDLQLLHAAPLPLAIGLALFEQVASVLKSAHSMGVVHRDISPSNIMIQEDARGLPSARVLDFGMAMLDEQHRYTIGPIGTPRYLAPEQLNGNPTTRSDMFSLGAVMWWAFTGHEYLEQASSILDIFHIYTRDGAPNDPLSLRPTLDPQLAALISHMLQAEPSDRPDAATAHQHLIALTAKYPIDRDTPPLPRPPTPIGESAAQGTATIGLALESTESYALEDTTILQNRQIVILDRASRRDETIARDLEHYGAEIVRISSPADLSSILDQLVPDAVLISAPLPAPELRALCDKANAQPTPPVILLSAEHLTADAPPASIVLLHRHDGEQLVQSINHHLQSPERALRHKIQGAEGLDLTRIYHLHNDRPGWLADALEQVAAEVPALLSELEAAIDASDLRRATLCAEQLERASHEVGLSGLTQRTNDLLRELVPSRLHVARERHADVISAYMAAFPTILKLRSLLPRP
jgi:serine/threonine protein kinase